MAEILKLERIVLNSLEELKNKSKDKKVSHNSEIYGHDI